MSLELLELSLDLEFGLLEWMGTVMERSLTSSVIQQKNGQVNWYGEKGSEESVRFE